MPPKKKTLVPIEPPKPLPAKKTLMSIVADVKAIDSRLEFIMNEGGEFEGSDIEEYVEQLFQVPMEQLTEKVNSYCWLITELENNAEMFETRAEQIMRRANADTKKAQWLRARLLVALEHLKLDHFEAPDFPRTRIRRNGGVQPLVFCTLWEQDPNLIPAKFKHEEVIPEQTVVKVDKDLIRKEIEAYGPILEVTEDEVPNKFPNKLAWLGERGRKLIIE